MAIRFSRWDGQWFYSVLLALTTLRMLSHSLLVGCLYRFLKLRVENADINQRLLEVIEQIGSYSKQIRSAIEDGVVEPHEQTAINDELYLSISKLGSMRHWSTKFSAFQKE